MNVFNKPSEETMIRIANALEATAKTYPQTDFSESPGSKFLARGDKEAGFYGFVQPSEFGKIGDVETGKEFNGVNLALEVGISSGTSQFSDVPWKKFSIDGKPAFAPMKSLRHSITHDAIYNAGAVYGVPGEGTLPPTGRLGVNLSIDESDNSINGDKMFFLGDKTSATSQADTVGKVGETLVLKGWGRESNNGEVEIVSITNDKIVVSGKVLTSEVGGKSSRFYEKTKAVAQNKTIKIGGLDYIVTLMKGAGKDPVDSILNPDRGSTGAFNEYNALILPLHEQAKLGNWAYPQYAKSKDGGEIGDWGVGLTDENLQLHHLFGSGNRPWMQEVNDSQPWHRVLRGGHGASSSVWFVSWSVYSYFGWFPVLRLK